MSGDVPPQTHDSRWLTAYWVGRGIVLWMLLLSTWSVLGSTWSEGFRTWGTWWMEGVRGTGVVLMEPITETAEGFDTRVMVANRQHADRKQVPAAIFQMKSRHVGFNDLCLMLALALSAPNTLRRRAKVTIISMGAMAAFVVFRLHVAVLYEIDKYPPLELPRTPAPLDQIIVIFFESYVRDNLEAGMLFAFLVFGVVVLPPAFWQRLLGEVPE